MSKKRTGHLNSPHCKPEGTKGSVILAAIWGLRTRDDLCEAGNLPAFSDNLHDVCLPPPQAPPQTFTISSVRGGWHPSMEDSQRTVDREQQTLTAFRDSQKRSPLLEPPSTSELEDYCGIKILRDYVAFTPPHLIGQLALPCVCTTSKRRSQSESSIVLTHECRSCQMEKIRGVRFISKTASSLAPASL